MTREEAIDFLLKFRKDRNGELREVVNIAIEALKDRPIICPRCGRTFSEAEGRESEEIQGLEYAENILDRILKEQEEGEE